MSTRGLKRLLYRMEILWVGGPLAQMGFLLALMLLLAVLGGLLMLCLHPRYRDLGQASWWAFLHLTDTGYLGEDKDPVERVVAVGLTFIGAVLFVGGVIAILTTWLDRVMAALATGRGLVVEEGHLLLLGSNAGLSDLIAECASASAQRWPGGRLPTIVVLSESPLELSVPARIRRRQRVVFRTGNPAEVTSLERCDFSRARVILVLSSRNRRGPGPSDLNVLKTLVAVRAALGTNAPQLVLDLSYAANALLIPPLAGSLKLDVLSSLEFAGRLICQCIRFPGISRAYRQLLSDAVGQSILLLSCPKELVGRTLADARAVLRGGIVMGTISQGRAALLHWEEILLAGDELVVLAPSLGEVRFEAVQADPGGRFGHARKDPAPGRLRILAVGWSEGLLPLASELRRYQDEFSLSLTEPVSSERLEALRGALGGRGELEMLPHRLRTPDDLRHLPQQSYDRILLLSSDHQDPATADAETALRYALLLGQGARFVVELHEEENAPLFGESQDVVVTDQVVNHMLAQISLKPAFRELYEELFTEGGCELRLLSLQDLLGQTGGQVVWSGLSQQLYESGYLAVGAETAELYLNPAPDWTIPIQPETRVLVLVRVGGGEPSIGTQL